MRVFIALLALATATAYAATGCAKVEIPCYFPGERSVGAEGYPEVEYKPCCDGGEAVPRPDEWGLFCPGSLPTVPVPTCAKYGERVVGAEGYPPVEFNFCCDGWTPSPKEGDWGKFCLGGDFETGGCYGPGERQTGGFGYPAVQYKPCCNGKPSVSVEGDWGEFCT